MFVSALCRVWCAAVNSNPCLLRSYVVQALKLSAHVVQALKLRAHKPVLQYTPAHLRSVEHADYSKLWKEYIERCDNGAMLLFSASPSSAHNTVDSESG